MRRSELTGQSFGMLVVTGLSEISRNGHSRWAVRCECGTEKTILGTHLISGKTRSCGCMCEGSRNNGKFKKGISYNFKGYGDIPLQYFSSLKRGASGDKIRKSLEFSITIEYLWKLFLEQDGYCKLSKLKIGFRPKTASVDRIDSSKGYVEGNVQWLHKDVNMMKRHYTEEYFKYLCKSISDGCEVVDIG